MKKQAWAVLAVFFISHTSIVPPMVMPAMAEDTVAVNPDTEVNTSVNLGMGVMGTVISAMATAYAGKKILNAVKGKKSSDSNKKETSKPQNLESSTGASEPVKSNVLTATPTKKSLSLPPIDPATWQNDHDGINWLSERLGQKYQSLAPANPWHRIAEPQQSGPLTLDTHKSDTVSGIIGIREKAIEKLAETKVQAAIPMHDQHEDLIMLRDKHHTVIAEGTHLEHEQKELKTLENKKRVLESNPNKVLLQDTMTAMGERINKLQASTAQRQQKIKEAKEHLNAVVSEKQDLKQYHERATKLHPEVAHTL